MRQFFSVLLIFVLAASLSACGVALTPKDTAEKYLDAVKAKDTEGIREVYDGSDSDNDIVGVVESLVDESEDGEEMDEAAKQLEEMIFDFDYTIGEERISGDNAEVYVTFKTYDFGAMIGEYLERVINELLSSAFNGSSEEEMNAFDMSILEEELAKMTEKSYEKSVWMKLTMVDGKWKVSTIEDDPEVLNAMLGGMVDDVKELEELEGPTPIIEAEPPLFGHYPMGF